MSDLLHCNGLLLVQWYTIDSLTAITDYCERFILEERLPFACDVIRKRYAGYRTTWIEDHIQRFVRFVAFHKTLEIAGKNPKIIVSW